MNESPMQLALKQALGGAYQLPDGRAVWVDEMMAVEILKRLDGFQFRAKPEPVLPIRVVEP